MTFLKLKEIKKGRGRKEGGRKGRKEERKGGREERILKHKPYFQILIEKLCLYVDDTIWIYK